MIRNFLKANSTALAASVVDFGALAALVEIFQVYDVTATAISACLGAATNFSLNHFWAFRDREREAIGVPGYRYLLVSAASAGLNAGGVFLFAHLIGFQYLAAKTITSIAVGWLWNYPMHRFYVWPKPKREGTHEQAHV